MPTRLSTTIRNITTLIPNSSNSKLASEFSEYMKTNCFAGEFVKVLQSHKIS